MWLTCNIILGLFVLAVAYCYVLFPLFLIVRSRGKKNNQTQFTPSDNLPTVAIIMAVYNEEQVIEQKLKSIFNTNYPLEKLQVFIGSDNSTDATHSIIEKFCNEIEKRSFGSAQRAADRWLSGDEAKNQKPIHLKIYPQRQGKPAICDDLIANCTANILIMTDANVYFETETIFELTKHYKNPEIGLVGALILNTNVKKTGISYQEKTYLSLENKVKFAEGVLGGAMIGAFGGAFSMRKDLYKTVPPQFIVDDFYITMQVLAQGSQAILEPSAVVYEDVANVPAEEFRRKVRISTGNFQNLREFRSLLFANPLCHCGLDPQSPDRNTFCEEIAGQARNDVRNVGFYFFSHKILRWLTPFFLCGIFILTGILAFYNTLYTAVFAALLCSLLVLLLDFLLKKIGIHSRLLRFISHFYTMNFALLLGFFKYIKGVQSNVWQPTKRNQD